MNKDRLPPLHPDRQFRDFCNFLQQYECAVSASDATGFAAFGDQPVNVRVLLAASALEARHPPPGPLHPVTASLTQTSICFKVPDISELMIIVELCFAF